MDKLRFKQKADADTTVRVHVAVVARDHLGKILLEKRSDCGLWGLPGGRVEPGESVSDAACREMFEETGFRTRVTRLLGVYSDPQDRILSYPDNTVQVVDVLLEVEILEGVLTISSESEEMRFFDPAHFPSDEDIIPPGRVVLKDIINQQVGVVR